MARWYCGLCRVIHGDGEECPRKGRSRWWNNRRRYGRGVSASKRRKVLERDGSVCAGCLVRARPGIRMEVDHVVPRSLGGTDDLANLQLLCAGPASRKCHQRKTMRESNGSPRRRRKSP